MNEQEKYDWMVYVSCMTFNQASYIVDAMNGFTIQKTDFPFVCAIVDDDSTDSEQEVINKYLNGHEMALIGMQLVDQNGVFMTKTHIIDCYEDFFLSDNKVWCTAWSRVIRKNKIVHFQENTLMEDRTWSYEQTDQIDDLSKVLNIKEVCYVWNRTNTSNSVSMVRSKIWDASAWKHIGEQLMLIERLRHKEMIPTLLDRIQVCKKKLASGIYQQY